MSITSSGAFFALLFLLVVPPSGSAFLVPLSGSAFLIPPFRSAFLVPRSVLRS